MNSIQLLALMLMFLVSIDSGVAQNTRFKNIRVSSDKAKSPQEMSIAMSPTMPEHMAAGSNIAYFYSSADGGLTWDEQTMKTSLGVWGDPCLAFDHLGNLYYSHLASPESAGYWLDRIVVQKSIDGGKTWNDGAGVGRSETGKHQDKSWLSVDLTSPRFRGNLYVAWTEFDQYGSEDPKDSTRILFARSTDSGETWSSPLRIGDMGGDCIDEDNTVEGAVPAVGPDGEVYIAWSGPQGIYFDRSMNGGITWGEDRLVTNQPGGWDFEVPGISRANGMPITACDASSSAYRGSVYVCWSDQRNGPDDTDIFLARSTDGGETWGAPRRVNDDTTGRHQFFVWMTVDQVTGFLHFVFYDRRQTEEIETEVYGARSRDGGETFENYRISESAFEPTSSVFFGDYTNIAAHDGMIRPVWMRMDEKVLSVWTAIVSDSLISHSPVTPGE